MKMKEGFFSRIYCSDDLEYLLGGQKIKQSNISHNKEFGTIRGMHYQLWHFAETKIVRCIKGKVFDVAVDLRKRFPDFYSGLGLNFPLKYVFYGNSMRLLRMELPSLYILSGKFKLNLQSHFFL